MNGVKQPTVWIVDMDNREQRKVKPATKYQTDGYDQFMIDSNKRKTLKYNDGVYVFTIHPFYGNSSFCIYINESGVGRVLSNNEEALKGYVNATNQKSANQKSANQNAANKNAANKNAANKNAARQNAPLSPAGDVWIAKMTGSETISKADPNQADAYHKFMSMRKSDPTRFKGEYVYPDSTTIVISTFDGRTGNYPRFCQTVVGGQTIILSDNKEALESYNNRTQHSKSASDGGNRTKRTRKSKRSKRVHTSKRK
jgi:hypothetical protein